MSAVEYKISSTDRQGRRVGIDRFYRAPNAGVALDLWRRAFERATWPDRLRGDELEVKVHRIHFEPGARVIGDLVARVLVPVEK